MNTKKYLVGGMVVAGLLATVSLVVAATQVPMVIQIGPSGNVFLRGIVDSVSGNIFTVKSWGGDWTIDTTNTTQIVGTGSGQVTQGDFIGVLGTVDSNAQFAVNASYIRDWTPSFQLRELSITGVSGPTNLTVSQTGTWTVQAGDQNNTSLYYSVSWGDEGRTPQVNQPNAFVQTATFTHAYSQPGNYTVTFNVKDNQGQTATSTLNVLVTQGNSTQQPVINAINPSSGSIGTQVTITGSGFSAANTVVNFGSGFVYPKIDSDNEITFTVPQYLTAGCRPPMMCPNYVIKVTPDNYDTSVSNGNGRSNTVPFTVTAPISNSGINGAVTIQTCGGAQPIFGKPMCGTPHPPSAPFSLILKNNATGLEIPVTTGGNGNFTVNLAPGNYTITPSQQEQHYAYIGQTHATVTQGEYTTTSVTITFAAP